MSGRLAQCVLADHMSHVRGRYLLSGVHSALLAALSSYRL